MIVVAQDAVTGGSGNITALAALIVAVSGTIVTLVKALRRSISEEDVPRLRKRMELAEGRLDDAEQKADNLADELQVQEHHYRRWVESLLTHVYSLRRIIVRELPGVEIPEIPEEPPIRENKR